MAKKAEKVESKFLNETKSFFDYQTEGEKNTLLILGLDKDTMESVIIGGGTSHTFTLLIYELISNSDFRKPTLLALEMYAKEKVKEALKEASK